MDIGPVRTFGHIFTRTVCDLSPYTPRTLLKYSRKLSLILQIKIFYQLPRYHKYYNNRYEKYRFYKIKFSVL